MTKISYWEPQFGPGTKVSVQGVGGTWIVAHATTTAGANSPEYNLVPDSDISGVRLVCTEDKLEVI